MDEFQGGSWKIKRYSKSGQRRQNFRSLSGLSSLFRLPSLSGLFSLSNIISKSQSQSHCLSVNLNSRTIAWNQLNKSRC